MGDAAGARICVPTPSNPSGSPGASSSDRSRVALPERGWRAVSQQPHWYRSWVWRGGRRSDVVTARGVAVEALADWRLEAMADDVELCVSELVTNALVHARCPGVPSAVPVVSLGLRYFPASCVLVEVSDCDPCPPLLPAPGPEGEPPDTLELLGGRGLLIVRDLADSTWWQRELGGGKSVCASLATSRYLDSGESGDD